MQPASSCRPPTHHQQDRQAMESSPSAARTARTPNPTTPTCTVPGLLVGLTKLFNLTKVCAAPPTPATNDDDSSAPTTTKPGPNPNPDPDPDPCPDPRLVLLSLFHSVSSLKSAYVKLQRAHFPSYDADGAAAADEAVASELDSVAALRCLCAASVGIAPLVDDRWALAQRLEAEARRRGARVDALAAELRRLRRHNARLSRQVAAAVVRSRSRKENDGRDRRREKMPLLMSVPKELATPAAVVGQFTAASRSVANFAEMLVGGGGACRLTTSTSRYALEAHVWRAMLLLLVGGEEEEEGEEEAGSGCGRSGSSRFRRIMRFGDALDALMQFPRSGFAAFCGAAYLAAVPAAACGGNSLEHRAFVSRGGHPRTRLYRAFADAARSVWALRVLMAAAARRCSEPEQGGGGVRMFYARRGSVFAAEFMESVEVEAAEEARRRVEEGVDKEKLSVAFTVTPGVKVGDTVVRCRVLLCRRREGDGEGFVETR